MPRTRVDYADYNITVYRDPCPYRCSYCWAWRVPLNAKRIMSGKYSPIIEAEKIAKKMKPGERVVVSFTSDPYPPWEAFMKKTRWVIIFLRHGSGTVMVLTKNPVLALKDADIMLAHFTGVKYYVEAWLGTTITSADTYHPFSTTLEPNAPRTKLRLSALREYQRQGGKVWVSLEPIMPVKEFDFYPTRIVNTILSILDPEKIALVVLGRLNYTAMIRKNLPLPLLNEEEAVRFYRAQVPEAIDILKEHGIPYHVKKELAKVIP